MPKKLTKQEFIHRANGKHSNKYNYDSVNYINGSTKVDIKCPEHGFFKQSPSAHISNTHPQGCPTCGKMISSTRLTTEEFIKRANKVHNNMYDYSETEYVNASTKVKIKCPKYGVFYQPPASHLNGGGHPDGKMDKIVSKTRLTTEEFIERSKKSHGDVYDYSDSNYINSSTKIKIICPVHGVFYQFPPEHMSGRGCPKHRGEKIRKALALTTEEFIDRAKKIHGDKFDYSLVEYKNNSTKVKIIDKTTGKIFEQRPQNHLTKSKNKGYRTKITTEEFIKRSKKIHGDKYDYSLVNYVNNSTKVSIVCDKHGEFLQTPADHYKYGCNTCANIKRGNAARNNPTGWSYKDWKKSSKTSKNFDSYKVYVLEIWNDSEKFFKIGRTFVDLNKRFNAYKRMPYNWKVIKTYTSDDANYICELEKYLQSKNKKYKYTPLQKFNGCYECFSRII